MLRELMTGKNGMCIMSFPIQQLVRRERPVSANGGGYKEDSSACGALCLFLSELHQGKLHIKLDEEDIEESLIKRRLLKEIPYGHIPDLIELTKITRKVIQEDLEHAIEKVIDTTKSDYALFSGIQIHAPDANYIWPADSYVVVDGKKQELKLD